MVNSLLQERVISPQTSRTANLPTERAPAHIMIFSELLDSALAMPQPASSAMQGPLEALGRSWQPNGAVKEL